MGEEFKKYIKNKMSCRFYKFAVSLIFLLIFCGAVYSQGCRNYHKRKECLVQSESGFQYYGQSKSALFELDSTYSYTLILYGRKDYIVNVCTEKGYYPIHFKIIDTETNRVYYDNMDDEYYESVGFTIDAPQEVRIEVTLLAEKIDADNFDVNRTCVGVNILWRKTRKLGF